MMRMYFSYSQSSFKFWSKRQNRHHTCLSFLLQAFVVAFVPSWSSPCGSRLTSCQTSCLGILIIYTLGDEIQRQNTIFVPFRTRSPSVQGFIPGQKVSSEVIRHSNDTKHFQRDSLKEEFEFWKRWPSGSGPLARSGERTPTSESA